MTLIIIGLIGILIYYLLTNNNKIEITDFDYIAVEKVEKDIHVLYSTKYTPTHYCLGYYCKKTKTLYSYNKNNDSLLLNLIHQPINKTLHVTL